jgi:hypothetical protein
LELQLVKVLPASGAAVRVTVDPALNDAVQVVPQETPAGLEVTVPVPDPALDTVSGNVLAVKVTVTVAAADMAMVHWVGAPATGVQLELKLPKFELASGAAVRVTVDPLVNEAVQVAPQEIPAGVEVTVPAPDPALETVSGNVLGTKVAVTVVDADSRMVHLVGVPETGVQLELKLTKFEAASGVAVRVTVVPRLKITLQVAPQEIPAGVDTTVPSPPPALATASCDEATLNVATTDVLPLTVNEHGFAHAVPLTVKPAKTELPSAVAVSVIDLPVEMWLLKALQPLPQESSFGLEVTLPVPVPDLVSVTAEPNAAAICSK